MRKKKFFRKTKRLIVRPLELKDYTEWKHAYMTVMPRQNLWDNKQKSVEELTLQNFKKILAHKKLRASNGTHFDYAVFVAKTGELIGFFNIMDIIRSITQSAFLGYGLFNTQWKNGYAAEVLPAVVEIAFKDHGLHRLVAGIDPANKSSLALVKKFGFRYEGLSKRVISSRGDWHDLKQFALTVEDIK